METDGGSRHVLPFQLQFDKPLASQVTMAEWNPEKDLLAMVTEDSKVVLHRFNWQRLRTTPALTLSPSDHQSLSRFHTIKMSTVSSSLASVRIPQAQLLSNRTEKLEHLWWSAL